MLETRERNIVEYKKSITTDEPDAYAEAVLKFEGLTEKRTEELRQLFNKFYAEVDAIVHEETIEIQRNANEELGQKTEKVLTYKNGRTVYEEKEI